MYQRNSKRKSMCDEAELLYKINECVEYGY